MATNHVEASGEPSIKAWALVGVFVLVFYGLLARYAHDSLWAVAGIAGMAALIVFGAFLHWRKASARHPVPAAEYFALVWLVVYLLLFAVPGVVEGQTTAGEWLLLLPPLGVLPLTARTLLGDDGAPRGKARSTAYYLHQVIGILLVGYGAVLTISVLFIVAAPFPLVPGIMHLRAGYVYRQERNPPVEVDPRHGFMS
jgi:hypothetical protein